MLGSAALLVLAARARPRHALAARDRRGGRAALHPRRDDQGLAGLLYETESPYQYVQVLQRADGSRVLKLNEGVAVHSVWHPRSVLTGGEWDMFLVVPPLLDRPVERMLVIGNAGGTIARAYGKLYPDVRIDGVEIDPKVTEAGRRFLGLGDNPNLHVITDDGRPFLQLTDERYDVIVVDAYRQPYIPFYLATKEFFRARAPPPALPAACSRSTSPPFRAIYRLGQAIGTTVLAAFPEAWRWKPLRFNELVLAFDRPRPRSRLVQRVGKVPRGGRLARPALPRRARARTRGGRPADRRPRAGRVADRPDDRRLHRRGGELDEGPLPTAP